MNHVIVSSNHAKFFTAPAGFETEGHKSAKVVKDVLHITTRDGIKHELPLEYTETTPSPVWLVTRDEVPKTLKKVKAKVPKEEKPKVCKVCDVCSNVIEEAIHKTIKLAAQKPKETKEKKPRVKKEKKEKK
jgi:hypothetical protein